MKKKKKTSASITRKEASKKIGAYGKYAALTAIETYILLNPQTAQASSPDSPGGAF